MINKKSIIIILAILTLVIVFAISVNIFYDNELENDNELEDANNIDQGKNNNTISELYPNKTRLVWVTYYTAVREEFHDVHMAFNKLLVDKGYDFVVDFHGIDEREKYQDKLKELMASGEQVDILDSGFGYASNTKVYESSVRDGLLEPLDSYFKSETGQKLYNYRDPIMWKTVHIDGKAYGVDTRALPGLQHSLVFNKKLMDKYDIDISDLGENIWDMEKVLKVVYEGEKDNDDFALFPIEPMVKSFGIYDYITDTVAIRLDANHPTAINIFEDEYTIKYFNTIKRYYDLGYIQHNFIEDDITYASSGNFFTFIYRNRPGAYQDIAFAEYFKDKDGQPLEVESVLLHDAYAKNLYSGVLGIASWSEHKDKALELLTILHTDAELANLLAYGIEGIYYELEEGRVKPIEERRYPLICKDLFPYNLIRHTDMNEPLNKLQEAKNIKANMKESPILGFRFNPDNVLEEISATDRIIGKYGKLWEGYAEDVDGELNRLNTELKDLGIERIIEEVNMQLKQWKEGYSD